MSARGATRPDGFNQVVLRWSDRPGAPFREEIVDIVETRYFEAVVRSALQLSEDTEVCLTGGAYSEFGVVRSCRAEGNRFMLTIRINPESSPGANGFDPGVLAVDSFLTEEQEAKILQELDDELARFSFLRAWRYLRLLVLLPFPA